MILKLIIFTLITTNLAFASGPTVEGLFRNGSNPALVGDTVAMNIKFVEQTLSVKQETAEGAEEVNSDEAPQTQESFYKVIFSMSSGQPLKALQVRYLYEAMEIDQVLSVKNFENLNATLAQESSFERLLVYSFILMYGLNDSSGFSEFLKRYGRGYVTNKEMVNKEKINLYEKYKEHLRSESEGPSPLEPETEQDKENVAKILSAPFYKGERNATLVRNGPEFLWEVNLDTFKAQFDHTNRKLMKINVATFEGEVEIDVGPYVAVNGEFELPTFILLRYDSGRSVKIYFSGYQDFNSRNKKFAERYTDYQKFQEQSQKRMGQSKDIIPAPSKFMY